MKYIVLTRYNVAAFCRFGTPSETWTTRRTELFEQVCFPSLADQSDQEFDWILFVDSNTDPTTLRKLKDLQKRRHFDLCFLDKYNQAALQATVGKFCRPNQHLITTRLDNDDALHSDFVRNVKALLTDEPSQWLNFDRGLKVDPRGLYEVRDPSNPFLSLSEKGSSAPRTALCKDHTIVAATENVRHIVDYHAWLQVVHTNNICNRVLGSESPMSMDQAHLFMKGFCGEVSSYVTNFYKISSSGAAKTCPAATSFSASRSKLNRALLHAETIDRLWATFSNDHVFESEIVIDSTGIGSLRVVQLKSIPEEFSFLFGEVVYQLRSSLNACIYQASLPYLGIENARGNDDLEFPICPDSTLFSQLAEKSLTALPREVIDRIEAVQPYNTPFLVSNEMIHGVNRWLGALCVLDRIARHRQLRIVASWVIISEPEFVLPEPLFIKSVEIVNNGFVQNGAELARFQLGGYTKGTDIQVPHKFKTTVGLDESPFVLAAESNPHFSLREICRSVELIISAFEDYYCWGL